MHYDFFQSARQSDEVVHWMFMINSMFFFFSITGLLSPGNTHTHTHNINIGVLQFVWEIPSVYCQNENDHPLKAECGAAVKKSLRSPCRPYHSSAIKGLRRMCRLLPHQGIGMHLKRIAEAGLGLSLGCCEYI